RFNSMIRDELPVETYLELAMSYYNTGCYNECEKVLQLAPQNALVEYWLAFLQDKEGKPFSVGLDKANNASPAFVFPFRSEDEAVMLWAKHQSTNWKPKYYLALLHRDRNRIDESRKLFAECGNEPQFAPFYAARAATVTGATELTDLKKAVSLEPAEWRYTKLLCEYYVAHQQVQDALNLIQPFYAGHPDNYIIGILNTKVLLLDKRYKECADLLTNINILPFEGATIGRELYHQAQLMLAIDNMAVKKYTAALAFIDAAKKWPQNLGAGKPYDVNTDERLEDWMTYSCYVQTGENKEASALLHKIVDFKPEIENGVNNFLPANELVAAWAVEKLSGKKEAVKWLNAQATQYPDSKIISWCKDVFKNQHPATTNGNDAEIQILKQLVQVK
ncbi:MAG: hypothetical protein ABIN13_11110, partial [Mucilaginibacter sp.]